MKYFLLFVSFFICSSTYSYAQEYPISDKENVFFITQGSPRFPGCEEIEDKNERLECANKKMLDYLASKIVYTEKAKKERIQGQAVYQFIVEKDGSISNI